MAAEIFAVWEELPLCGHPVGAYDCAKPARYFADIQLPDCPETWRIYRCAEHAGYPMPGDVVQDGDVVQQERAR